MEVHHHSHIPASREKKWTHYFWEFLMLFLAVFCGFLAENQREHFIEHKREKQFILSLINDLKLDTSELESKISVMKPKMLRIDSVLYPLTKLQNDKLPVEICIILSKVLYTRHFFSNDGTIQQLKESGGLRLIRKRGVVDSLEAYHYQIKRIMLRQEFTIANNMEVRKILNNFINGKDYFENRYESVYGLKPYAPDKLVKIHPLYLNELINSLMFVRNADDFDVSMLNDAKKMAVNMINYLSNEYNLSAGRRTSLEK
jgi:hypothetical protein